MAASFLASLDRNILRVQQEVNDRIIKVSIELFLSIVAKSPSPTNPGKHAVGLLANQWYPAFNGFSEEKDTSKSSNGQSSRSRITALRGTKEFFGKDASLSLTNNLKYAYRAEMLGWPQSDGWSGKVGPYRMVALSLQAIAARYK
jgi:hypothetical protein